MPVRRKVFRIEEMNLTRRSAHARAALASEASGQRGNSKGRDEIVASDPVTSGMNAIDRQVDAIRQAMIRTKQELAAFEGHGAGGQMTARALRELAAVADDAEAATQRILTAAEEIDEAANNLSALAKQAQPQALAHDIRDQVIRIFEACNFQDLAGQRIASVVTALNSVEAHNACMLAIWSDVEAFRDAAPPAAEAHARDNVPTSGPRLDGDAGHVSQAEIDTMFEGERVANSK